MNNRGRIRQILLAASVVCLAAGAAGGEDSLPLQENTALKFASPGEGRQVLTARDRFTTVLSRFDLESRLQARDVTLDDYLEFVAGEVRPWEQAERDKVRAAAAAVARQLQAQSLQLPFPRRILLVHTSGNEEGGAAYCRGAAIVLPQPLVRKARPQRLEKLLAHELFHVLSANNEPLRRRLYALIGFQACPDVELPDSLRPRKLTNPDGPGLDYSIRLQHNQQPQEAVPLLYASVDRYDPQRGGTFFQYLQFKLLGVERSGKILQAKLVDGQPLLIDPKSNESFHEQIGGNTGYIYHPDEILADNFVYLLREAEDLKSPELIDEMRTVFKDAAAEKRRKEHSRGEDGSGGR